jgi:hypothetical protein
LGDPLALTDVDPDVIVLAESLGFESCLDGKLKFQSLVQSSGRVTESSEVAHRITGGIAKKSVDIDLTSEKDSGQKLSEQLLTDTRLHVSTFNATTFL